MQLEWDFTELVNFADNLDNSYDLETYLMTITQNIAKVLHKYLLEQTPVDTGNLRKMWSAGDNLQFTVEKVKNGYQVTLINTATNRQSSSGFMYGLAVNDGHRTPSGGWVTGRFFVENSIDLTKNQVNEIVMTELRKWWEGC